MAEAKFDFDDGGFRGWGTIIPNIKKVPAKAGTFFLQNDLFL